jgi:hypothetical protein
MRRNLMWMFTFLALILSTVGCGGGDGSGLAGDSTTSVITPLDPHNCQDSEFYEQNAEFCGGGAESSGPAAGSSVNERGNVQASVGEPIPMRREGRRADQARSRSPRSPHRRWFTSGTGPSTATSATKVRTTKRFRRDGCLVHQGQAVPLTEIAHVICLDAYDWTCRPRSRAAAHDAAHP